MTSVTAIHDINSFSDHMPIALVLDLATDRLTVHSSEGLQQHRVSGVKANNDNIKNNHKLLSDGLKSVVLPVNAHARQNVCCRHDNHRRELDTCARGIIDLCYKSSRDTIPQGGASVKQISGWSEFVEPLRQNLLFRHSLWTDCDKARTGPVADSSCLSLRY
jgi:hypothetical protein